MLKLFLKKIKEKLKKEKASIEEELQRFAKKDERPKGDWDTKYPDFNGGAGSQLLESEADEVEEYEARLPVEYSFETRLRDINSALEKIEKKIYGKCEKCGKNIPKERLKIFPEAKFCLKCRK